MTNEQLHTLTGTIANEAGETIEGASVCYQSFNLSAGQTCTTTNDQGFFALSSKVKFYSLSVYKQGYERLSVLPPFTDGNTYILKKAATDV